MEGFRRLDPDGTGALPRPLFEAVMRDVCQASPAWLESLDFALGRVSGDEVRYEDFFNWIYAGSAGRSANGRGLGRGAGAAEAPPTAAAGATTPLPLPPAPERLVEREGA